MTTFKYRLFRPLLATVVVLMLSACASSSIQSTVDIADQADFSNFQTYAWITDKSLIARSDATSELGNPLNRERTRAAVEREIAGKGYRKVSGEEADLVVSFNLGSRDRVQVRQSYNNYGYSYHGYHRGFTDYGYAGYGYRGYGDYASTASVQTFTEGNLFVDIFDNRSKKAIWHGSASKRLSRKDKENAKQLIDQAILSLLTEFPDTGTVAHSST